MEHDRCYIFKRPAGRPAKRRKLDGDATSRIDHATRELFEQSWKIQQAEIDEVVHSMNFQVVEDVVEYATSTSHLQNSDKIPAVLVKSLPGSSSQGSIWDEIERRVNGERDAVFVALTASHASNLKTLLQTLIQKITKSKTDSDGDEYQSKNSKDPKLLNYDLQLVQNWCRASSRSHIIVALQDIEVFDVTVISDFIDLLHCWRDRISFRVCFGITTPLDFFQARLPRRTVKLLQGKLFEVPHSLIMFERIFETMITANPQRVRIGPLLGESMMRRHQDHLQSVDSFVQSCKIVCMSHFAGNPLSALPFPGKKTQWTDDDWDAVRGLPSFRGHIDKLLDQKKARRVRELFASNVEVKKEVDSLMQSSLARMEWSLGAIKIVRHVRSVVTNKSPLSFPYVYTKVLAGGFADSSIIKELLLFVKKCSLDMMNVMLGEITDTLFTMPPRDDAASPDDFAYLHAQVEELIEERSGFPKNQSDHLEGVKKAAATKNRVQLSREKTQQSEWEDKFSAVVAEFHDLLESYFRDNLTGMREFPVHEVLFYDLRSPFRDVLMPQTRLTIERALSQPHDYLGCDCCAHVQGGLSASQPETAILYQLYLESGALINVYDLWSAFHAILDDEHDDEKTIMALFSRGLAELKYLGMIKHSRRKADHLAKLAWKGL